MKRKTFFFIVLSIILWFLSGTASYYIRVLTLEVLKAKSNESGWTHWVYEFYPRLATEKWRFDYSFFVSKAYQILIRFTLTLNILLGLYVYRHSFFTKTKNVYQRLTNVSIERKFIPYITILFYSCLLLVVYNAILEFHALNFFRAFYKPIGIGKILLPSFPPYFMLWLLYATLLSSMLAVVFLPKKWIASTIAAVAFIYYQLILFGFGKYDHGFSTLTYALLIYPFFLWEVEKSKETTISAWAIVLIQWMICLSYFYCGLEKIFTSGPRWFYSDNLQHYLLLHETKIGLQLASYATLCKILSFGVLIMQLSFILIPFRRKLIYILLPFGILFHTATWLLLDAGGLFNPWWGVYLFFLFPLQPQETK